MAARELTVARLLPIAAGLLALASPPPAAAQQPGRIAVLVAPREAGPEAGWLAERTRQLIVARLARHGFAVHDAGGGATAPAAAGVRLDVRTDISRIDGTYSSQATLAIVATLADGATGRHLARLRTATDAAWRVPDDCVASCFDRLAYRRAEPLAVELAAGIAARLSRLVRDGAAPGPDTRVIAFRGLAPDMAPEIERYLRAVPGLADLRREPVAAPELVFRYRLAGASDRTEESLRRMIRHLRLDGAVTRRGNALVVEAAAARDW